MTNRPPELTAQQEQVNRTIGKRLEQRRLMLGLSRGAVAKTLGVSHQQVEKYENGKNRASAATVRILCDGILNCPVALIMGKDKNETASSQLAPHEARVLRAYRRLSPDRQLTVSHMIIGLVQMARQER